MIKHWIKTQKTWILILVLPLMHHDVKRVICLCFKLTALKTEIIACLESGLFWYTHVLQCTISADYKPWDKTNFEITDSFSFRILILQITIISIKYSPFQMWYQVLLSHVSSLTGHALSHFNGNSRFLLFRRLGGFLWESTV